MSTESIGLDTAVAGVPGCGVPENGATQLCNIGGNSKAHDPRQTEGAGRTTGLPAAVGR